MAQQKNWAFYPLWPILIRFGAAIFHCSAFHSGIILSNLLFLGGIVILYRLLLIDFKPSIAYLTSTLIVIYPSSYFFSRPGPESLFFFLTILAFLAAKERRWAMAGITAGLATVTRMQGIILIVPLLLVYYKQYRRTKHHDWRILWLFCVPMATIGFMVYLYALTGNIWANFEIQSAWDSKLSVPFLSTIRYFINPLVISYYGWDLSLASFVFIVLSTLLSAYMFVARGFPSEYTAYAVLNLLVIVSRNNIQAAMRFLLPVFPFFLATAILIQGRRLWNDIVLFFLTSLQAAYFIAYVNQYNFAHT
jgi:Gpi18-like mannosyltransferase